MVLFSSFLVQVGDYSPDEVGGIAARFTFYFTLIFTFYFYFYFTRDWSGSSPGLVRE